MSKTKKTEQVDTAIASAEEKLANKYGDKIVKGSVRRATDSKYGNKLMVTINTVGLDGQPDGKTREVATSDVFQVHHQPEVAEQLRKLRAKEKREAKKQEKAEATA